MSIAIYKVLILRYVDSVVLLEMFTIYTTLITSLTTNANTPDNTNYHLPRESVSASQHIAPVEEITFKVNLGDRVGMF